MRTCSTDWSVGEGQGLGEETGTVLLATHRQAHLGMEGAGKLGLGSCRNTGHCLVVRMENWCSRASGGGI